MRRPPRCTLALILACVIASVLAASSARAADPAFDANKILRLADREGPRRAVLARALDAFRCAGVAWRSPLLTVIDYELPSTERRLWVIDVTHAKVLFHELVAHGRATGDLLAERFSNRLGSHQSSLGLYQTLSPYQGEHGLSLRLRGLEPGVNDRAEERAIVMHGAWYATPEHARRWGRLGRSLGCPAVDPAVNEDLIDAIAGGSALFAYYPEPLGLRASTVQCRESGTAEAGL
jgi:hypothetical protein